MNLGVEEDWKSTSLPSPSLLVSQSIYKGGFRESENGNRGMAEFVSEKRLGLKDSLLVKLNFAGPMTDLGAPKVMFV